MLAVEVSMKLFGLIQIDLSSKTLNRPGDGRLLPKLVTLGHDDHELAIGCEIQEIGRQRLRVELTSELTSFWWRLGDDLASYRARVTRIAHDGFLLVQARQRFLRHVERCRGEMADVFGEIVLSATELHISVPDTHSSLTPDRILAGMWGYLLVMFPDAVLVESSGVPLDAEMELAHLRGWWCSLEGRGRAVRAARGRAARQHVRSV